MSELIIALFLLAFVIIRIINLRRQRGFGVYAFPVVRPTKYYTSIYPGYAGGNAYDRRKVKRRGTRAVPYSPQD